jgi:hypothetical protein
MIDPGDALKNLCDRLVSTSNLWPEYDSSGKLLTTYCNMAARIAAQALGCSEFDDPNLIADDMVAIMKANKSGRWESVTGQQATLHALDGGLAFAAADSKALLEAHGHITLIRPESMQPSPSWGKDCPMVVNVGKGDPGQDLRPIDHHPLQYQTKPNWNCKVSQAFPVSKGEPGYFCFK